MVSVHCQTEPVKVNKGNQALSQHRTKEEFVSDGTKKGWFYDKQSKIVWIKTMAGWYCAADERGIDGPEKDTVCWIDDEKHEEGKIRLSITQN